MAATRSSMDATRPGWSPAGVDQPITVDVLVHLQALALRMRYGRLIIRIEQGRVVHYTKEEGFTPAEPDDVSTRATS
ncbi:MAG: hypothetical protein QN157_00850 [Armatimonadota bacterium]|nr:hypothetical protein [Armatimonadota bacterium]